MSKTNRQISPATQPDTKDVDMALALEKAHTQKNYAECQLVIVKRERDALQAQRDELLAALHGLIYGPGDGFGHHSKAERDAALTAIARVGKVLQ